MVQPIRKIDLSIVTCWNLILLVMIAHFGGYKAANAQENWSRFRGDRADGVAADDAAKVFNLHLPIVWIQVQTLKDRGERQQRLRDGAKVARISESTHP